MREPTNTGTNLTNVIVTGGAGFVGCHVCKQLKSAGFTPVTFDNLSTGWRDSIKFGPIAHGSIMDRSALFSAFSDWKPDAVVHLAAMTSVEESISNPNAYWACNVEGTQNVLDAMKHSKCKLVVLSSTCAVYGDASAGVVNENSRTNPKSPYAETKLAAERLLAEAQARSEVNTTVFRYFNVAGSDPEQEIGEQRTKPANIIPTLLECAMGNISTFEVFGTDWPTPDGTCIRDYIHASDVADAHVSGLKALFDGGADTLFNIGTGYGHSVREVVECATRVTGVRIPVILSARRPGDVSRTVSDCGRAAAELGWRPKRSQLNTMVRDAWNWRRNGGYSR